MTQYRRLSPVGEIGSRRLKVTIVTAISYRCERSSLMRRRREAQWRGLFTAMTLAGWLRYRHQLAYESGVRGGRSRRLSWRREDHCVRNREMTAGGSHYRVAASGSAKKLSSFCGWRLEIKGVLAAARRGVKDKWAAAQGGIRRRNLRTAGCPHASIGKLSD